MNHWFKQVQNFCGLKVTILTHACENVWTWCLRAENENRELNFQIQVILLMNDGRSQDSWDQVIRTSKHFNESKTERLVSGICWFIVEYVSHIQQIFVCCTNGWFCVHPRAIHITKLSYWFGLIADLLWRWVVNWTLASCYSTRPREDCIGTARRNGQYNNYS